jgi:hypothetical protein
MRDDTVGIRGDGISNTSQHVQHILIALPGAALGMIFPGIVEHRILPGFIGHKPSDFDLSWSLIKGCIMNNVTEVKKILNSISSIDFDVRDTMGRSPLHIAASLNHGGAEMAKLILDTVGGRYLLESFDNVGMTPLHTAAFSGSVEVLQLILTYQRSCCDEIREADRRE